jgi:hypothetical protein
MYCLTKYPLTLFDFLESLMMLLSLIDVAV